MKAHRLNFRKATSDRKAERSLKASFYRRLEPFNFVSRKLNYHLRSKFPLLHGKISTFAEKLLKSNK